MHARGKWLNLIFVWMLFGSASAAQVGLGQDFLIHLPHEVKPERVLILAMLYDEHSGIAPDIQPREGIFDYRFEFEKSKSLRLLIYCPGYKMVTAEFEGSDSKRVFTPVFEPLPTIKVEGLLLNSAGQPIRDRTIRVTYDLLEELFYFGHGEGLIRALDIDVVTTDAKGAFVLKVPSFADDPFFQNQTNRGHFSLDGRISSIVFLDPESFTIQEIYSKPLRVVEYQHGRLIVRLGPEFCLLHNLDRDNIGEGVRLMAEKSIQRGKMVLGLMSQSDGTFGREVPPGIYDLFVSSEGLKIAVRSGIVVQEGLRQVINVP